MLRRLARVLGPVRGPYSGDGDRHAFISRLHNQARRLARARAARLFTRVGPAQVKASGRSVRLCRPDAEGATAHRWRSTSAIMTSTASWTGELLHAEVAVVDDEHVPAGIDGDARRSDEL